MIVNHSDEKLPANDPLLLMGKGHPLATVRLDFNAEIATLRLIAVTQSEQGKRHGRHFIA